MLANYLASALRNLLRNRAYAAINLFGLSLGIAAALLIALYVRDEYSYDRFFPHADRMFQIGELIQPPGSVPLRASVTAGDIAPAMKTEFPDIEAVTRLTRASAVLRHGNSEGSTILALWADPNFFQLFPMRAISGELANALNRPDGIVLTRSTALRIFGREGVAGEVIELNRVHSMRVSAVIQDLPLSSHFKFEALLPGIAAFSALTLMDSAHQQNSYRAENVYSYLRLRTGGNVARIRAGLRAFTDRNIPGEVNGFRNADAYTFVLTPIADIHFLPHSMAAMKPPSDPNTIRTLVGVALLILIVATCNFTSMMSARAARRATEVGVRKAVGATRAQLTLQFMAECVFYAVLAMACAAIAVAMILPAFNGFLQRQIVFDFVTDRRLGLSLVGATLLVGVIAGSYPALVLSRFRPSVALRDPGLLLPRGSSRVRGVLVVFQFGTLIGLIITTLTVQRQIEFATQERLRLPTDQIYMVSMTMPGCTPAFTNSARTSRGVRAVTCVSGSALGFDRTGAVFSAPHGATVALRAAPVDSSFFKVFGIRPLAGRLLSAERGEDDVLRNGDAVSVNPSVVINESAARALGFGPHESVVGESRRWARGSLVEGQFELLKSSSSQVVGVVPDFSIGSVRDVIEPTAYYLDPAISYFLVLQLDGLRIPETLSELKELWAKQGTVRPFEGRFLNQYVNDLYSDITQQSAIFTAFVAVAIVIAALGLLGLAIFSAERRTKEIGLRKVMGASRFDILRLLAWEFVRPVLWANLLAWPCAYVLMRRWLEGFAYHVDISPWIFAGAGLLAVIIALGAVAGHALNVARAKPVRALRYE